MPVWHKELESLHFLKSDEQHLTKDRSVNSLKKNNCKTKSDQFPKESEEYTS